MNRVLDRALIEEKKLISIISEFDNYKKDLFVQDFGNSAILLTKINNFTNKRKKTLKTLNKYNAYQYFEIQNIDLSAPITHEDNVYLSIIFKLLEGPSLIIINDLMTWLSKNRRILIMEFIKENDMCLINLISNIEEALYTKYVIVLNASNEIEISGDLMDVLKEEKILSRLGFALPFYYDLSLQLNYYDVLDKIYMDKKALEGAIWK